MKRIILILGTLVSMAAAHIVLGQNTTGVITYEVKVNLHRNLPKGREEMKNMIPEFRVSKQQLFFNMEESLYRNVEEDEEDDIDANQGGVRLKMVQPQIEIYSNQLTSRRITQQEFAGKNYLIEDTLKILPWKFGTETKVVLGQECKQALYYNEERQQNIVAWYSPQLRPFLGPEIFSSLPGAILQLDINEGERVVTAKLFEARPLKKSELKAPTKGIKISRTEFRKMMDQQMEQMRANGGHITIRD